MCWRSPLASFDGVPRLVSGTVTSCSSLGVRGVPSDWQQGLIGAADAGLICRRAPSVADVVRLVDGHNG